MKKNKKYKRIYHKSTTKYKDALFKYIFGNEKYKQYTLSLYNALNHTYYTNTNDLEIVTLDNVLLLRMKNDVAFIIDGTLNLFEQQSTWNPNMAIRMLEYVTAEISRHHQNLWVKI